MDGSAKHGAVAPSGPRIPPGLRCYAVHSHPYPDMSADRTASNRLQSLFWHLAILPTIRNQDPLGSLRPRQQPVAFLVQELKAKVQQAFHYRAEDRHMVVPRDILPRR
ncbi:hypothetical protein ASPBRDRAFT_33836 [Aspergillus brasiliensis CBS 101740]|uniref:Uncharacterized protein n=1 Tax=Aspergillus brasiliensis (strain CBS 101740 / IMI 381727 / IBT 21946) TaxID=767769 RepID=A0A1L9U8K4_ASPBC|nr:hypothetical protein ASPBRDRAFT_33836 [Aspergillus brasiliensis CBS 101740]